jgi:hypothetical protein
VNGKTIHETTQHEIVVGVISCDFVERISSPVLALPENELMPI